MEIRGKNNVIFWDDIENDPKKQQQILDLVDDVKKYFNSCNWNFFNKNNNVSIPYISLAKSIIKEMNVKLIGVRLKDNKQGKTIKRGYVIYQ